MTARNTRAVRIAAGSTAAALVMCTVSLVGTANAADNEAPSTAVPTTATTNPPVPGPGSTSGSAASTATRPLRRSPTSW